MSQGLKILIVDGSRFFRSIEKQFLAKTPAEIIEAESGEEALKSVEEHKPELVYIAVDLPDMSGVDLCRKIKANSRSKQTAVILICDQDDDVQVTACQSSSSDGVLTKPIDRHKFLEVGRQFLVSIREPRRTCLFPITFRSKNIGSDASGCRGKCLDISSGGVFIESTTLPDLNSMIDIEFVLPHKEHSTIVCKAMVTWHNTRPNPTKPNYPIGLGVKFVDLKNAVQESIKAFSTRFQ